MGEQVAVLTVHILAHAVRSTNVYPLICTSIEHGFLWFAAEPARIDISARRRRPVTILWTN